MINIKEKVDLLMKNMFMKENLEMGYMKEKEK